MKVQDKFGRFAKHAETLSLTDEAGAPTKVIKAGATVVHGPFRLVTKDQIARVVGIVTESMFNAVDKDGAGVYEFKGNGWNPQVKAGHVLLQDAENPLDRWACAHDLFGGTGWVGLVGSDLSVTYSKPGKPLLAVEIPEGTLVDSLEGERPAPAGCLLAITNADKGDFYVWTDDVVKAYVRDYIG